MKEKSIEEVYKCYNLTAQKQAVVQEYIMKGDLDGLFNSKILWSNQAKNLWGALQTRIGPILETRFAVKRGPFNDVTAVIMGPCGSGKTSLFKGIYRAIDGEQGNLSIYDTPGTTSNEPKDLCFLRATLTHQPLNVIFIHVKFKTSEIDTIKEMQTQLKAVNKYETNVVYLVSHFDQADNIEESKKVVCDQMKKRQMNQQVVFYSNTRCKKDKIARTLHAICSNYKCVLIQISQQEFLQNFGIARPDDPFKKEFDVRTKEIKAIKEVYLDFIQKLPSSNEREDIFQALSVQFKSELADRLNAFLKETDHKLAKFEFYGMYYTLQKFIQDEINQFKTQTQQYNLKPRSVYGKKTDIRDLIKQCPRCGAIWLWIEGCSKAFCGERPSSLQDQSQTPLFQYLVRRVGNKLHVTRRQKYRQVAHKQGAKKNWMLGCGAPMRFEELPRLKYIDEILMQWYQVETIAEVDARIKADEIAEEQRLDEQQQVRRSVARPKPW